MSRVLIAVSALACTVTSAIVHAAEITVVASKDNTLFESLSGANSNGSGPDVFAGMTGGGGGNTIQRAVIEWDLSDIPPGSTVTAAQVTLTLIQGGPFSGTPSLTLHRVLAEWGEGSSTGFGGTGAPSTPGDATWIHTFFPGSLWASPGGDFSGIASASQVVGNTPGPYVWASTPQLVADVQAWVDDPSSNHGLMLRGNEAAAFSSKKFASRENTPCPADFTGPDGLGVPDGNVDSLDFLALIALWGADCEVELCFADITGPAGVSDGAVDALDYLALIAQWGSPANCVMQTNAPKLTVSYTAP